MPTATPVKFWNVYREILRQRGSWQAYQADLTWSPIAIAAAMDACKEMGFKTQKEYLRLDVIGYETRSPYDWDLHVAFEHENRDDWRDELCKLTHVVADVCVLVSYHNFNSRHPLTETLQSAVDFVRLAERNRRVLDRQWLFVFGPRCVSADYPFQAFTLDGEGKVAGLADTSPLIPSSWKMEAM